MADSSVAVTPGAGANIDTFTQASGDHRQAVVIGDPSAANVAQVSAAGALYIQGFQGALATLNVTTSSSTTGALACTNYNIAMVSIHGTHAGINLTWEISDDGGTTWYAVQAQRDDTGAVSTTSGVITSNASWSWTLAVGAATHMRVRSTAFTSGTGIVGVSLQSMPYEPIPSVFVQGTVPISGALTANQSVNVAQMNGVATTMGNGVAGTGVQRVAIASDNTAFTVNTTPTVPTTTAATLSSAATTNATSVKASAGTLFSISVSNTGAAAAFFKLYNKASAPTVGTDVPVLTITIPAGGTVNVPFGSQGFRMATGIAFAITNLAADSDTTAVAAAQVKAMVAYI